VRDDVLASVRRVAVSVADGTVGLDRLVCSNELRRVPPRPACDNGPSHRAYRQRYGRGDAAGLARGDRIAYVFVEGDDDAGGAPGVEDPGRLRGGGSAAAVAVRYYLAKKFEPSIGRILGAVFGPSSIRGLFLAKRPRTGGGGGGGGGGKRHKKGP